MRQGEAVRGAMETNEALRARVLALVQGAPGTSTRQLAAQVGMAESTVDYHLRRLGRAGEVSSVAAGRSRRWFASEGNFCPVLKRAIPELRRPEALAVARVVDDTPASVRDLVERSGLPEGTIRWVSAVLHQAYLIEKTKSGRVVRREGAERCLAQACAARPCPEWGRCPVSLAWERDREPHRQPGRLAKADDERAGALTSSR